MKKRPDFFIVGAPKSGTTAMWKYLKSHPDIYMPSSAEMHYFGSDLPVRRSKESYYESFEDVTDEIRIGEKSTTYLMSEKAASEIKEFSPDADIIIMLRNPTEMVYSLYWQLTYGGRENKPTFEEALEAEERRKQGQDLPSNCDEPERLYYRERASYAKQVKRYLDVFTSSHVHIILYDDFKKDTPAVYKNTLEFLGVEDDLTSLEFKRVNANKQVRSAFLRDVWQSETVKNLLKLGHWLPESFRQKASSSLLDLVRRVNTQYVKRPPMSKDTKEYLNGYFQADIRTLESLIDRDLSHWT